MSFLVVDICVCPLRLPGMMNGIRCQYDLTTRIPGTSVCVCVCVCECSIAYDDIQNIPRNFAQLYFASLPFAFPYFPLCLRIELMLMYNLGLGQT